MRCIDLLRSRRILAPFALLAIVAAGCGSSATPSDAGLPTDTAPPCTAGLVACDNTCVNPNQDLNNCGACGNVCPTGMMCSSLGCLPDCGALTACPVDHPTYCTDLRTDVANCGSCGTSCDDANSSGASCGGGACTTACGVGFYLDGNHCVACGAIAACAGGLTCTGAEDQQCAACESGTFLVDGAADLCAPCSAACSTGSYEANACADGHDRTCVTCAAIGSCAAETCTTETDQACTVCTNDTFWNGNSCGG